MTVKFIMKPVQFSNKLYSTKDSSFNIQLILFSADSVSAVKNATNMYGN